VRYVGIARGLTPEKRVAILGGWDETSFAELSSPRQLALPFPEAKVITKLEITDSDLMHLARTVGVERMLNAAAAVEHA
jgi:hypothetical protein